MLSLEFLLTCKQTKRSYVEQLKKVKHVLLLVESVLQANLATTAHFFDQFLYKPSRRLHWENINQR